MACLIGITYTARSICHTFIIQHWFWFSLYNFSAENTLHGFKLHFIYLFFFFCLTVSDFGSVGKVFDVFICVIFRVGQDMGTIQINNYALIYCMDDITILHFFSNPAIVNHSQVNASNYHHIYQFILHNVDSGNYQVGKVNSLRPVYKHAWWAFPWGTSILIALNPLLLDSNPNI